MKPKVFISYSWTSPGHQTRIRQWAEQLVSDGVDVILDIWHLKEGNDKYAFMESMVTDESVTHVLVFCDSKYSSKADARTAGVGTESQIISSEVYAKVKQSKFLPIVCEFDESGEPCLPTFFKSIVWIDFSSPEASNNNWEKLIRVIYGKPAYEKPALGQAPTYISADSRTPADPTRIKFIALQQALIQEKRGLKLYREDFLKSCLNYADSLRIRDRPDVEDLGKKIIEDCSKLKVVRDHIVDWALLESEVAPTPEFDNSLIALLENLIELRSRPPELTSWNEAWFEAHRLFVYETFLYVVSALLKTNAYRTLNLILTTHFLSRSDHYDRSAFKTFEIFYHASDSLQILAPQGQRLYSPAAELLKRQADRSDFQFSLLIQSDLLVLMMTLIKDDGFWYPQTFHYASSSGPFPFFLKAARKRDFKSLASITGVATGDELRTAVKLGHARLGVDKWHNFRFYHGSFWEAMNMDALDTLS